MFFREKYSVSIRSKLLGAVTARFFETAYQERVTVASIQAKERASAGAPAPAVRLASAQADLETRVTDAKVAPGSVFSAVVDVTPRAGMHVYAPGVTGYRPVSLAVTPQPYLKVKTVRFPPPEDWYFQPLDEHVKVYTRAFRIIQDLALDASAAGQQALQQVQTVTIRAVLEYQACDDKMCYNPVRVPLEWTVPVRTLDRERAAPPQPPIRHP